MGRGLTEFIVKDLSRSYIQLVRSRIEEKDPRAGYVLFRCITEVLKLLAPISPFVADKIYQNLNVYDGVNEKSVHLERLPRVKSYELNKTLENEFELIQSVISDSLSLRDKMNRTLRWPIKDVIIATPSRNATATINKYSELISNQINSMNITTRQSISGVNYSVKLNFRETGKTHGKLTNEISKALGKLPIQKAISEISKGSIRVKVKGKNIKLSNKEVIVNRQLPKGLRGISRSEYILYFDPEENKEMLIKGYTRELTRKIQDLRKGAKLKRSDKISVQINVGKELGINDVELKRKTNTKDIQFNLKKPANPNIIIRNTGFLVKIKRN